jgi:DNA polymerase-1
LAEVHEAERQAVNTIIQGTAADLMKMAVTRVHRALPEDSRLLLTVHDSVLVEVPAGRSDEVAAVLHTAMEISPHEFSVPIKVDTKIGPTWG